MRKGQKTPVEAIRKMVETRKKNGNYIAWNKDKKGVQVSYWKGRKRMEVKEWLKCFSKGNIPWNKDKGGYKLKMTVSKKGIHYSPETEFKKGRISLQKGEKNWNWKGGITPENHKIRNSIEYRLWREAVFARDNWICQKSGEKGGKLVAHHINNFCSYPELRFAIDNGITLSEKAHRQFHKKYNIRYNTQEQLEEFLNGNE